MIRETEVRKSLSHDDTDQILTEICKRYECKVEYPWAISPDFATVKDICSDKWFALFMIVEGNKLGLKTDRLTACLNVKADPEFIHMVKNSKGYCPAYHMNKEHWLTLILDGSLPIEEVLDIVDTSYHLISDTPSKRIYEAVKKIPRGKVASYGQVAALAGNPKMSRAVGNALHKNPDPGNIPCYRVVNSQGKLAEAFAFGGVNIQKELLEADGIEVINGKVDLEKYAIQLEEFMTEDMYQRNML